MKDLLTPVIILAVFLVGYFLVVPEARGQNVMQCDTRENLMKNLKDSFGEVTRHSGFADSSGFPIEVLVSPGGDTFTIVVTYPHGLTCRIAAGWGWTDGTPQPTIKKDSSY